jgi:hypothetical protein
VLAHPAARLGPILGQKPLLWLGLRSYSFYLWHWPVLVLTRPGIDVSLPRGILIPLQLLATLALADLSYRYVELPFRGKARLPGLPDGWLRVARPALIGAALAVVLFVGWSGLFSGSNRSLERAQASTPATARVKAKPVRREPPPPKEETEAPANEETEAPATAPGSRPPPLPPGSPPPRIIALGDSVMVGAAERLSARLGPGLSLNAKEGRQATEFVEIVEKLKREGHDPAAIIIQMGNNGPLYGAELEAIQKATADVGELFLITDHAPVSWIDESNGALAEAAEDWPHTTLIDWAPVAAEHEAELWDGIHLKPSAAALYAQLVNEAVRGKVAYPAAPRKRQNPPDGHRSQRG